MRVLSIGGTGTIGRLVVARLHELGDDVVALVRDVDRGAAILGTDVDLVEGDLGDVASLRAALRGADAVVLTHGAPYGSGDYEEVDYGAVPTLLEALDGRRTRVALMTSIGVTGTGGASRELLDWKHRGERLLRASGLDQTVVRPGWFSPSAGERVVLRQGDRAERGDVRPEHVAEILAQAIRVPEAIGRTVEVFSTEGTPVDDWAATFAATDADEPGALDGPHDPTGTDLDREPARVRDDLRRVGAIHTTTEGDTR